MKKVVFIVPSLSGGGAERVVSVLANKLVMLEYRISIVCLLKEKKTYWTDEKVNIEYITDKSKNRVIRNINKMNKFRKVLKKIDADVVISFTYDCSMITSLATIFMKSKLIISERNDPNNDPENKWIRIVRNILYKRAHGMVYQTEDASKYYKGVIKAKGKVISNPLNDEIPEVCNENIENIIFCASRLAPQKNLKLLIDGYVKKFEEIKEYNIHIYGDGPLKNELKDYINSLNMGKYIKLKGFEQNLYEKMKYASIFVIPSDYEGMSNSMIEALALGIPVVATDCPIGGAKMFIKEGNGYLSKVNDVDDMSEKLLSAIKDSKKNNRNLEAAKNIREALNSDRITSEWKTFILEICEDKKYE